MGTAEEMTAAPTTRRAKVLLTNDFHGTSTRLVGEVIDLAGGVATIRVSRGQVDKARRTICGMRGCRCASHGPRFDPEGNPSSPTCTFAVAGEVV